MSKRFAVVLPGLLVAALALVPFACGGGGDGGGGGGASSPADTGPARDSQPGDDDAGSDDAAPPADAGPVCVAGAAVQPSCGVTPPAEALAGHKGDSAFTPTALDLESCEPDPPPPADPACTVTLKGTVIDFKEDRFMGPNDDFDLTGTRVKVFYDNQVEGLGDQPDAEGVADNTGAVTIEGVPCNRRVALLVFKATRPPITKPTIEYNFWTGPGPVKEGIEFVSLSVVSYNLIPGILGYEPDENKGIIAGRFYDCANNYIENGIVQLTAGRNECLEGGQVNCDVGVKYFIDEWPDRQQPHTSPDGLFALIDVPPGPVTVHVLGRLEPGGDLVEVSTARLIAIPGSIAFSDALPRP